MRTARSRLPPRPELLDNHGVRKQPFNEWYFTAAVFVIAAAVPLLLLGAVLGRLHWDMVGPGILMSGLLILVVWFNVDTLRFLARASAGRTPAEILDERLARGEIDVEEYDRLRKALQEAAR